MFRRILVSTDGTPRSGRAIKTAASLARTCGATLTIYHAIPAYRTPYYPEGVGFDWPPESEYMRESAKEAAKLLAKARALAAKEGATVETAHSHSDETAESIVAAASKARAELIVMASHGRKGLEKMLIGSETQRVLSHTKIPVLVVR